MERTDCPVLVVSGADFSGTCAVQEFDLDCAFGIEEGSENDFTAAFAEPLLSGGEYLMVEGTEYGGVVDKVKTSTTSREAEYSGRTWHGMLAEKVLCPDAGKDYLSVSGDANACLATIVSRCGLGGVFKVRTTSSGIAVDHTFDRYCDAWTGVTTMLRKSGAKLAMSAGQGGVEMWAEPVASLGSDVDSDAMDFDCETVHRQVNHLVGLGDGELKDRAVSHWYADGDGNVSQTRTYSGVDEIAEVYDYSNADAEKLAEETEKKLKDLQGTGTISFTVADIGDDARIGDVVTARDNRTGRTVTAPVTKKVAKVEDGVLTASYSIGDESAGSSTLSGSAEANAGTVYTAGDGISISSGRISADVTQSKLDAVSSAAAASFAHSLSASVTATSATVSAQSGDGSSLSSATVPAATSTTAGVMTAADKAKLDGVAAGANRYALPAATSSALGGVKVGSNLTVSSGTLSVTKANVVAALGYTPAAGLTATKIWSGGPAYSNDVTMWQSAAGYKGLTIVFRNKDGKYGSVDVGDFMTTGSANGKQASLVACTPTTNAVYFHFKNVSVSGKAVGTVKNSSGTYETGQCEVTNSNSCDYENSDFVGITDVIGWS